MSHGTENEPIFCFGNENALALFEMDFDAFTRLPSRYSAGESTQEERNRLMRDVTEQGFSRNYSGVRISATGRRFRIENAVVWNLIDSSEEYRGQAAMFAHWTPL